MSERRCAFCGKDLAGKRVGTVHCSDRCRKADKRGASRSIIPDKWQKGSTEHQWPNFRVVAGPTLFAATFHAATISDRDPKTGRSAWEELEERNRKMRVNSDPLDPPSSPL